MKSAIGLALAGFAAAFIAAGAQASNPVEYYAGPGPITAATPATGTLGSITDTFSGAATLQRTCLGIPISLNCTLTLGGEIFENGGNVALEISSGSSTGGGLCGSVSFPNIGTAPHWNASVPHSVIPANFGSGTVGFNVGNVVVATSCGNCSGSMPATFNNSVGSFSFSGTIGACTVASPSLTGSQQYSVRH